MLLQELKEKRLYMDGATGTMLQAAGLPAGELPERWGMQHREVLINIHRSYFDAGCNIACTNTFGANLLKYGREELRSIIAASVEAVRAAAASSSTKGSKYIALDIGPLGRLLKPYGDLDFEQAVEIFAETVKLGVEYGVDLIFIETMNDSYETKAAVLAAKENSKLPVFVCNAYGEDGKLLSGASPASMAAMLEGLGAAALGANCSLGPKQLESVIAELLGNTSLPIILKPNAGIPTVQEGKTAYGILPREFAEEMRQMAKKGVQLLGGCCGTSPEYVKALIEATQDLPQPTQRAISKSLVASYTHCVELGNKPVLIGERINPTGKKRFKQALLEHDIGYILQEGIKQQEKGAHILDVNVGLPEINEPSLLEEAVCELQCVLDLPLQLDTADTAAMEQGLRRYNGKAMLNSVNGKKSCMEAAFPLVKKYGAVVVALTIDEDGIPTTAEGRVAIADKILHKAAEYGIKAKDIIFDPLCMSVSADSASALITLKALRMLHERGLNTVLGISNISFGLPRRELLNSSFLSLALENGLSAAIINPFSEEMLKSYYAYMLLHDMDKSCAAYIGFAESLPEQLPLAVNKTAQAEHTESGELHNAIVKGLRELAAAAADRLLQELPPLQIINEQIVPALDFVGKGFEQKRLYLPQLLMSAEAAKAAFECVKQHLSGNTQGGRGRIVLATVQGDIHDIGKNIVKVLLENYGFSVTDLGKDVEPQRVLHAVLDTQAQLCGLSALMTTTVPAMAATIKLLKEKAPQCRIVVGGAVLNPNYAKQIKADYYAADAMETVRYAEEICK